MDGRRDGLREAAVGVEIGLSKGANSHRLGTRRVSCETTVAKETKTFVEKDNYEAARNC